MITTEQAAQYLDQALGVGLPPFVVAAAVDQVGMTEPAMIAAGYRSSVRTLVQCMAVALVAAGGSPRRIASQGAPSGASRSFKNPDADLSALRRSLAALDVANTVSALVGPDPAGDAFLMIV